MAKTLQEQMHNAHTEEEVKDIFQNFFEIQGAGFGAIDLHIQHIYFEAKYSNTNIFQMLAQLLLTIYRDQSKMDLPEYIGGFDKYKCGIVEFDDLWQKLTSYSDINWNQTPSSVDEKTIKLVEQFAASNLKLYEFGTDDKELKTVLHQIQNGRGLRGQLLQKKINSNNFVSVFMKWQRALENNIADIDDQFSKKQGILPGDFYLADLLSEDNKSIPDLDKLKILRDDDKYVSNVKIDGSLFVKEYKIKNPDLHNQFWNKYRRPPKREYWNIISERRDLLVPQGVREFKGAFFTPAIWVEKSQEYLANVFGDDFANMYIWDCAAGTGNLLAGLPQERRNIFASTLDTPDVEIMKQNMNLFENQVFQFDFLNDDFKPVRDGGKLPDRLYDIIQDPEEQKKLIIYINPPYAEAGSGLGRKFKDGVSKHNQFADKCKAYIGKAVNEVFALFITRIYQELPHSILTLFSTLKIVSAPNFTVFRNYFRAKYLGGFVVRANTFDNVKGHFPIGFTMWNLDTKQPITNINCDIIENDGTISGTKHFFAYNKGTRFLNDWLTSENTEYARSKHQKLGWLIYTANDYTNNIYTNISSTKATSHKTNFEITNENLINTCIYLAVRLSIPADWLNDRDQFLFPTSITTNETDNLLESKQKFLYKNDDDFKNNCLIFALFHTQNHISSKDGINHWLPFSEDFVGCKSASSSDFMYNFLKTRNIPESLSPAALAVYNAGLALWRYYHANGANPNASLYDIKEFFKGRNDKGKMNNRSTDPEFNRLESELSNAMRGLASEIEPKIYEYGFLKK